MIWSGESEKARKGGDITYLKPYLEIESVLKATAGMGLHIRLLGIIVKGSLSDQI